MLPGRTLDEKRERMKLLTIIMGMLALPLGARSPHRPVDPGDPTLITSWDSLGKKKENQYPFTDSHIQEKVFYQYDETFLKSRLLPIHEIPFRYHPQKNKNRLVLKNGCFLDF